MEIEFKGPVFMTKESKFEDLNESLEDFAVTKDFEEWYVNSCKRSIEANNSEFSTGFFTVDRFITESFLKVNEISVPVFMLGPVAIYQGKAITAKVRSAKTVDEIIQYFRNLEKPIALFEILKSRPRFESIDVDHLAKTGEILNYKTPVFNEGFYKVRYAEL